MNRHYGLSGSMRVRLIRAARRLRVITPLALSMVLGIGTASANPGAQTQDNGDEAALNPPQPNDNQHEPAKTPASTRLPVTADDIEFLQRRLNAQGYEAGAVDGDFGIQSQKALLASLRDTPAALAVLGPDFIYVYLTQNKHLPELKAILDKSAANREAYLTELYEQRGELSPEHMQFHLRYFAEFYHGPVDGIPGPSTERAIHQLEAHVDPPRLSNFHEQNLGRAAPENTEIRAALEDGNIEWLRWHLEIDEPLHLGRPVDGQFARTDSYLDPGRDGHHAGVDYATPTGTELRAHNPARVAFAGDSWGYGNTVILEHGVGTYTLWAHLSEITAEPGAFVQPGDLLGEAGSTGRSTGPHLHYEELLFDGREAYEINPTQYDDYDLTDESVRAFAIADARSAARKHGYFGDSAVSGAFNARALGEPGPYLHQAPSNRAGLHGHFDPRTARAVVAKLDAQRDWLGATDADVLYRLGLSPASEKLAQIMRESRLIARRLRRALEQGESILAQKLLAASDYYKGAIDGDFGPRSKDALRAFQGSSTQRVDFDPGPVDL